MADLSRRLLIVLIVSSLLEVYTSPVFCLLLQKRCKMWADAGECDANPGFMTNNCKVACKKCTLPVSAPTKKAQAGLSTSPANLISKAAVTVQQGVSDASEAAGSLVSAGQEAAGNLVSTGKEAADSLVGTGKEAAGGLVSSGKEAAGNLVGTGKEAVGQLVSTGKDIATNLSSNVTAVKDKVTGGSTTGSSKGQNHADESVLGKAAATTAVVSDKIKQALAKAANVSRGDTAQDAPGVKQKYDDSLVRLSFCARLSFPSMCKSD